VPGSESARLGGDNDQSADAGARPSPEVAGSLFVAFRTQFRNEGSIVSAGTIRIVAPSEVRASALLGNLDGFQGQVYAEDGAHEVHVFLDNRTAVALTNLFHAVGAWLNDGEHAACTVHFGDREFTLIAPRDGEPADPASFLLERTIQLQTALDTRLVIEQAKGILAERFGVDIDEAFSLLRAAARSNSLKIHALATDVVKTRQLPHALDGSGPADGSGPTDGAGATDGARPPST
jgi:hypothetical protein